MAQNKCPYCKSEFEPDDGFCPHCGWYLKQEPPSSEKLPEDREIEEARIFLALSSHEKYKIEKTSTTLGRDMGDIVVRDDLELSRLHCEFVYKDHQLHVKDLDSHNGVFIGDRRIPPQETIPLQAGDKIKIGSNVYTVEFKSDTGAGEEMGPVYYLKAARDSREYQLRLGENLIGRGEFCHVRIADAPYVAHEHAVIELREDTSKLGLMIVKVQDKGSKNQTHLNGVAIPPYKWRELDEGDELRFADREFTLVSKPRE